MLGFALLLALAVVGADAMSVSASEHEFVASASGKVTSKSTGTQVFKAGGTKVECTSATGEGSVTEGKQTTNKEVIKYSGCTGSGIGKVTIGTVHFEFNANGSAKIENEVVVTPESGSCHVIIPAQSAESVTYSNESGGKVMATSKITKIASYGTGGSCGTEEETSGTYSGSIEAELSGGTLSWK